MRLGESGEMPSMPKAPAPYDPVRSASRNQREGERARAAAAWPSLAA
jgi:hypothetical protein